MKFLAATAATLLLAGCAATPSQPVATAAAAAPAKPACARNFDGTGSHISDRTSCQNGNGDVRYTSSDSFAKSQRQSNPMTVPGGR